MYARMSPRGVLREWKKQLPDIGEAIRTVPTLIQQALMQAAEGRYRINVKNDGVEELRRELRASARRRDQTILASALLFSSVLWFAMVSDPIWPGALCLLGGILTLFKRS